MGHMSARSTKPKRLTLIRDACMSGLEKFATENLSKVGYAPPAATRIKGSRPQSMSCRRTECKPRPKFSWSICRQTSKRGIFRPMIAPYLPSPNFPPCPTCTRGCSAAAPTDHVCAIWQVTSAPAQKGLDSTGPIERLSRLRQSFIKRFNH